jgi:hypothetical protein
MPRPLLRGKSVLHCILVRKILPLVDADFIYRYNEFEMQDLCGERMLVRRNLTIAAIPAGEGNGWRIGNNESHTTETQVSCGTAGILGVSC